jgi:hypothetical protein
MEAIHSSEMLVSVYKTMCCHKPQKTTNHIVTALETSNLIFSYCVSTSRFCLMYWFQTASVIDSRKLKSAEVRLPLVTLCSYVYTKFLENLSNGSEVIRGDRCFLTYMCHCITSHFGILNGMGLL